MEIANVEAAAAWDGHEGEQWAVHADRYEWASRRHRARLVRPELIGTGDRLLDIGCGNGASTLDAARLAADGSALGIDLSSRMLEVGAARAAAAGVANVEFVQGDVQVHPFERGAADVAISSFGCMFFGDPVAAFTNVAGALRPGGRLALMAWRELERNEWLQEIRSALALGRDLPTPPPDAPTPFSLADPERVESVLGASGFDQVELEPIDEAFEPGTDVADALGFLSTVGIVEGLLQDLDEAGRAEAMRNLERMLAAHVGPDGLLLGTSAWLITAARA